MTVTPRDRFVNALERKPPLPGPVPHFELAFFLTMEAFGRISPFQRHFSQWKQMTETERDLHRRDVADLYIQAARHYGWAGIFFHEPRGWEEEDTRRAIEHVRDLSGREFFLAVHGDGTMGMPAGADMMEFVERLADRPDDVRAGNARREADAIARAERIRRWGTVDGFGMCVDYALNDRPFLSPAMFDDFVAPYLAREIGACREMGFYVIKHSDGNLMPVLDAILAAKPHALHSLDPQGGMDLAHLKRAVGGRVCLIGNVNCALLQTGTDDEVAADARRALRDGMPGGGYIFGTSNCIYTGMPLARYDLMLDIWRKEGIYR
ncbi:MAG: uroporphyrinogen decarboxylase family protein [Planctomycetota bacterium]